MINVTIIDNSTSVTTDEHSTAGGLITSGPLPFGWNYEEEIEKLKKTPLYADGRYDAAVADYREELDSGKKKDDINTVAIAHRHFDPEYNTLRYVKKAELLTNIEHMRVDTIAH